MFNLRSLLLFSILVILSLFIVQNLSTVLPLIIFGMRTPALPLGVWVLAATSLGFISSLFLQLPSKFNAPRSGHRESRPEDFIESPPRPQTYVGRNPWKENRSSPEISEDLSDWDLEFDDDWQEREPVPAINPPPRTTAPPPETKDTPIAPSRPPATYAYGTGDTGKSGVGNTEAVYDANYRVINAPFSPPPAVAKAQEEDWGLGEDDDSVFDFPEVEAKDSSQTSNDKTIDKK